MTDVAVTFQLEARGGSKTMTVTRKELERDYNTAMRNANPPSDGVADLTWHTLDDDQFEQALDRYAQILLTNPLVFLPGDLGLTNEYKAEDTTVVFPPSQIEALIITRNTLEGDDNRESPIQLA